MSPSRTRHPAHGLHSISSRKSTLSNVTLLHFSCSWPRVPGTVGARRLARSVSVRCAKVSLDATAFLLATSPSIRSFVRYQLSSALVWWWILAFVRWWPAFLLLLQVPYGDTIKLFRTPLRGCPSAGCSAAQRNQDFCLHGFVVCRAGSRARQMTRWTRRTSG